MVNINKFIRADPSFPSWLLVLFCFVCQTTLKIYLAERDIISGMKWYDCIAWLKLQNTYSGLCAALLQTTLTSGGAGEKAGSRQISVSSQNLPHFQFFSIKCLFFPPTSASCWRCSWAGISWVTGWVRSHILCIYFLALLGVHHPSGCAWTNCTGSKAVSKTSSQSSSAPKCKLFVCFGGGRKEVEEQHPPDPTSSISCYTLHMHSKSQVKFYSSI